MLIKLYKNKVYFYQARNKPSHLQDDKKLTYVGGGGGQ